MSLLAIDIGSSQCKAVVFAEGGAIIARSVQAYSPEFPQSGFAEMDPAKFWDAVCATSREEHERRRFSAGEAIPANLGRRSISSCVHHFRVSRYAMTF